MCLKTLGRLSITCRQNLF